MTAMIMVLMTEDEVAHFGRSTDAGFGALSCDRGALPLTAMDVDARVAGVLATIEVAQTFVNTTGVAIEATYIFPLPDRAAVHRFRMEVAGRVIEGVVDERGAAREQYDEAIAAGHRAAITEEERAGVFTLRVGNLMPGEVATIRLSLVGPLPVDDGEVTFQFPLVVAPRYIPGAGLGGEQAGLGTAIDTALVPDASRISPPVRLPGFANPVRLGLRVAIEDHGVREVASSLHAVTTSLRDARVVEVQPGERLDRDFILRWRLDGSDGAGAAMRSSLTCADDADGKGGTFLLTLVPPSTVALAAKPRDIVFVLDRSGSMGGWKMVAARRAAARMIDTLTSRDRFCTIAFDNIVELVPAEGLVAGTDRNRFRAVEALAKIDARGGTEMMRPLENAVRLLAGGHDDRERVIVLVTDGQVGNEDQIVRELTSTLRNVRMFALGVDQAVNAAFLRRLASAGGGLCELVESEDRLDAVMAKVHRRIGTPIATNLGVRATGLEVDATSLAPAKLPDLYAGAPVTILGRYRGTAPANAAIELDGTSMGDAIHERVARAGASETAASRVGGVSSSVTWLAASWARAHLRDLEDRYASGAHELEGRIVHVSKSFGVLSRFTAYLAVDRSQVVNPGGRLRQVVQAVESPAGWNDVRGGGGGQPQMQRSQSMAMPMAAKRAAPGPMKTVMGAAPEEKMRGRAVERAPSPSYAQNAPSARPPAPAAPPPPASQSFGANQSRSVPPSPGYAGPPAPRPQAQQPPRQVEGGGVKDAPVATGDAAYLTKLGALARELEQQARGRNDTTAIRLIRQRLVEWVEDVTSVGGLDALARAVGALVKQLSAALAGGALATEALVVAEALAELAGGQAPPVAPKPGRSFWK